MAFTSKFVYISHLFTLLQPNPFDLRVDREGCGLSTLCHSCRFACQKRVLKTFSAPGNLRSEDEVVWLWHLLVNLYIYKLNYQSGYELHSHLEPTLCSCFNFISLFSVNIWFGHFFQQSPFCFKWNLEQVITLVGEWIDTYGIYQWRILRSTYRKLVWVGFEPTTIELCSDTVTKWAIRPWVSVM